MKSQDAPLIGLSVTQRITTVSQPSGGYVSVKLFDIKQYDDLNEIIPLKTVENGLQSIQGLAVDYLTRYKRTGFLFSSFSIPYAGAAKIDQLFGNDNEINRFKKYAYMIRGIDDASIRATCVLAGYDTALRMGVETYREISEDSIPDEMIHNIRVMVDRGITFLKDNGPVVADGMTFEGGYTELVSSGDGDYLTKDALIDFKASKNKISAQWSLQLLMYYILGLHSKHKLQYKRLTKLCIFNPYENKSYTVNISDIPEKSKYKVSQEVLGYKMKYEDYSSWEKTNGSDIESLRKFYKDRVFTNDFKISDYEDGIYDISLDDYWACLRKIDKEYANSFRPQFKHTDHVKMIIKNKYIMFLSVSPANTYGVLNGGRVKKAYFSPEYYYENIERYAQAVKDKFGHYWQALKAISKQIKKLRPDEKYLRMEYSRYLNSLYPPGKTPMTYEHWYQSYGKTIKLSGKIHGCIVDIDYMNHIYLNPYDGTVVPYYAISMYDKDVFVNFKSLISVKRPEMLESLEKLIETDDNALVVVNGNGQSTALVLKDDKIFKKTTKVYEHDMYAVSNRLKPLEKVFYKKLIQVWYDEILNDNRLMLEDKYLPKSNSSKSASNYLGQKREQKGGRIATIIAYRNYRDIDVQFEDGLTIEKISVQKWDNGGVIHPDVKIDKKSLSLVNQKSQKERCRDKYLGMTRVMNCGMKATIIEYYGCDDITVQFEDGFIRTKIRSDHFMEGKVARDV